MSGEQNPFRWRFIPATVLLLFGVLMTTSSLAYVAAQWFVADAVASMTVARFCGNVLIAVAGAVWIATGRLLQKGKWWRAGIGLIVGYAGGALGGYLAFPGRF